MNQYSLLTHQGAHFLIFVDGNESLKLRIRLSERVEEEMVPIPLLTQKYPARKSDAANL